MVEYNPLINIILAFTIAFIIVILLEAWKVMIRKTKEMERGVKKEREEILQKLGRELHAALGTGEGGKKGLLESTSDKLSEGAFEFIGKINSYDIICMVGSRLAFRDTGRSPSEIEIRHGLSEELVPIAQKLEPGKGRQS